jgi:hypothetical protein
MKLKQAGIGAMLTLRRGGGQYFDEYNRDDGDVYEEDEYDYRYGMHGGDDDLHLHAGGGYGNENNAFNNKRSSVGAGGGGGGGGGGGRGGNGGGGSGGILKSSSSKYLLPNAASE